MTSRSVRFIWLLVTLCLLIGPGGGSALGQTLPPDKQADLARLTRLAQAAQQANDPRTLAAVLNDIGVLYLNAGQPRPAIDYFSRCVELAQASGDKGALTGALGGLGQAYRISRQFAQAMDCQKQVLALVQDSGNPRSIATALNNLGATCKEAGRYPEAVAYLTQALELRKRFSTRQAVAVTLTHLALIYYATGPLDQAAAAFEGAIENTEIVSRQVREASQVGEFQGWLDAGLYQRYATVLLRQGKPEEALVMLERGRCQGPARQAARNRADFSRVLGAADAGRLRTAIYDYHVAAAELRKTEGQKILDDDGPGEPGGQAVSPVRRKYMDAEERLNALRAEISSRSPAYRRLTGAAPPTMADLKALADAQPDALFLEWGVGQETTSLLFALSKKDGLKSFILPTGEAALRKQVSAWREQLSDPKADPKKEEAASQALYATLFGAVEKAGLLAPEKHARLVLVGSGPLLELPFAALTDRNGKRLIERMPVSGSFSLGVLTWPDDRAKAIGTFLCAADPAPQQAPAFKGGAFGTITPLPGARAEGKALGVAVPGSVVLVAGFASKKAVREAMERYSLLHFATHGYLDDEDGLKSGLILSSERNVLEPEILEGRELASMHLSAQLAVLSACETGKGRHSGGGGLLGLTWAFRAAGCPSVVASLWSVEHESTATLMVAFYNGLRAGKRKDEALREAMLTVRSAAPRPFFWAAFQLTGDTSPVKL
jgi:CHAT domain-containing protein/tetratricopeptide (TPR) repeat protein